MPPRVSDDDEARLNALGMPDGAQSSEAPSPNESSNPGDGDDEGPTDNRGLAVIWLKPGKTPIESPDTVTFDMRENLRDLIHRVKAIHFEGTDADKNPTAVEMRRLLQSVFAGHWCTGETHHMMGKRRGTPSIDDMAVRVGIFMRNIGATSSSPANPSTNNRSTRRAGTKANNASGPTANKAFKVKKAQSNFREEKESAYMVCSPGSRPGSMISKFYDSRHKLLPKGADESISLHKGFRDFEHARGLAMQRYDNFRLQNTREYNLHAAIFMARNRLTYWANGHDVTSRPRSENHGIFIPYKLMRCMEEGYSDAAMNICRKQPVPELFDCMKTLGQ